MWGGFYNVRDLDFDSLKAFFRDALELSYKSRVDIRHKGSFVRECYPDMTAEYFIHSVLSKSTHNVAVDRSIQHRKEEFGEIGSSTLKGEELYLFIYVSLKDLQFLVEKYKLNKR